MSHDDFEFEPVPGLPAMLPAGERLLWQGSPRFASLGVRAYGVRKAAVYFGVLVAWRIVVAIGRDEPLSSLLSSTALLVLLAGTAIGVLTLLAWLAARATVYSVTSRRVLIRHGIAVPMTLNIPFKVLESARLKTFADKTGDIVLQVGGGQRVAYLINWPHLRPYHFTRPQPSLRALPDAAHAAQVLGAALAEFGAAQGAAPLPSQATAPTAAPAFAPATSHEAVGPAAHAVTLAAAGGGTAVGTVGGQPRTAAAA